jgi:hypothetical protein
MALTTSKTSWPTVRIPMTTSGEMEVALQASRTPHHGAIEN